MNAPQPTSRQPQHFQQPRPTDESRHMSAPAAKDTSTPTPRRVPTTPPGPWPRLLTTWTTWRGDLWFVLGAMMLGAWSLILLTLGGASISGASIASHSPAQVTPGTTRVGTGATVIAAAPRVFPMGAVGLMYPAVDAQGNIWFGEMNANQLVRLDPHTGAVTSWTPPGARNGLMRIAVDRQGMIWFAEQNANYIGRFTPATQTFHTYPLGAVSGRIAGPQDLAFDTSGVLWFTETSGERIGRLDPRTGAIRSYPLPAPTGAALGYPFSLAVAPDGAIWYGNLAGRSIGRLDPRTAAVTLVPLAHTGGIFSMAIAPDGRLWFTELQQGLLGALDTRTGKVVELPVPLALGPASSLYAVTVAHNGDVWFASSGANALVRYVSGTGAFTFFQLPTAQSIPYGLALDGKGHLWFTADAAPTNYVGMLPLP